MPKKFKRFLDVSFTLPSESADMNLANFLKPIAESDDAILDCHNDRFTVQVKLFEFLRHD